MTYFDEDYEVAIVEALAATMIFKSPWMWFTHYFGIG